MASRVEHDFSPAKKTVREEEEDMDMDMLSKLPDEILESILCLLSMEEAGRSRVLCRRWEKLWMNTIRFTPRLYLDFSRCYGRRKTTSSIVDWVNHVMKLNEQGQNLTLEELTIKAYNLNSDHCDDINRWIEFAAKKQVKKLHLDFNTPKLSFPLGQQPYSFVSNFPIMYWLRDLHINRIQVSEKVIDRLFSKSPFLERFSLIDSPCLHKLEVDSNSAPNLKYLLIKSCKNLRHLTISTPILNTIHLGHLPLPGHLLLSAPNLSNATFALRKSFMLIDYYLHLLAQIKTLTLELTCMVSEHIWHQIPKMTQLEHLELVVLNVPPSSCSGILMAAPFLHTIKLTHLSCYDLEPDLNLKRMEKRIRKKVKENLTHSHQYLKVVELVNFSECQIGLLLDLLKIAVSLEKLIIQLCPTIRIRKRKRKNYRGDTDILNYEDHRYRAELNLKCAQLLKIMRPDIDLVIN